MSFATVLEALLKSNADASSDTTEKVQLGTPGTSIMYPSTAVGDELIADATELGQMWSTAFLPALIEALGTWLSSTKVGFTPEGGLYTTLTNKTGSASVKGAIIRASGSNDDAFILTVAEDYMPIGAVYEAGIADGSECKVVIAGVAEVLLMNSSSATHGYWVKTSDTVAGRADATNPLPGGGTINALTDHNQELGHCIQTVTAGTDKLARIIMHLN